MSPRSLTNARPLPRKRECSRPRSSPSTCHKRRGEPVRVTKDEGVRPDTTVETLGGLRAAFAEGGSITAGNSSQISDGASAVVVTARRTAVAKGWSVLATVGASGQTAGRIIPCRRSRRVRSSVRARSRGSHPRISIWWRSTKHSARSWPAHRSSSGWTRNIVNIHGGGIAIGHPIGASGNRLVGARGARARASRWRNRRGRPVRRRGGQGEALILTR